MAPELPRRERNYPGWSRSSLAYTRSGSIPDLPDLLYDLNLLQDQIHDLNLQVSGTISQIQDVISGETSVGDALTLSGAIISSDSTLGGESPSALKLPNELAVSQALASKGSGIPIGTPIFWPYSLSLLPDCMLPLDGRTLIRADYPALWTLASYVTGSDRQQFGVGNGSTTFTLPDWRGEFLRGAYYGEISASDWDVTTNDDVDLGRDDIPMGTPILFSVSPCTGITAGTIYYLGRRTGNKYCLFDTEAHANANGATGKVALSGTPVDSSYTTAGLPQGSAMWGHWTDIYQSNGGGAGSLVPGSDAPNSGSTGDYAHDADSYVGKDPQSDTVHGTPSTSDESRSRNTQGIWCIQVTNGAIADEDRTNIEQRLTDLENAYVNNKYETPWINRSDWTNVHMGSSTTKDADSNVTHNLGKHLKDLHVRVLISPTGSDSDCFEAPVGIGHYYNVDNYDAGITVYEIDEDNLKLQTGVYGIWYLDDNGAVNNAIDSEDYYYKIIVVAARSKRFIDARVTDASNPFPDYANGVALSAGVAYQAPSNGYICVLWTNQYMGYVRVLVGLTSSPDIVVGHYGDDINSNTKYGSAFIPVPKNYYCLAEGAEGFTATFFPVLAE